MKGFLAVKAAITVDPTFLAAPLLNVVLGTELPTEEQLRAVLEGSFGDRVSNFTRGSQPFTFAAELDGAYLIHMTVIEGQHENPAEAYSIHPVLTGDSAVLERVRSQLIVTLLPQNTLAEETKQFRDARFSHVVHHAQVTAVLAQLPGTVAVHNTMGQVTFSQKIFIEGVKETFLPMCAISVWLTQGTGGISGYTVGMAAAGHPELQVMDSSADPTELYYQLGDLAHYALAKQPLKDGDTMAFAADAPPISIADANWIVDPKVPALTVDL